MEMRPPFGVKYDQSGDSLRLSEVWTYDVVVGAADGAGRARVARADADDADGRAAEAN